MKILAVDDDAFILELLTMMAARAGFYEVATALSGEIALDMIDQDGVVYDCLLLDISMPGLDGIELCARVRTMPTYQKTPIIMLTAMSEKDFIDRAFRAGATDYANKPFDIVELHARLRIAEELAQHRHPVASIGAKSDEPSSDPVAKDQPALAAEVRIDGIKDLIDYTALSNYLTQLSHAGIAGSQVIAVKIDRVEGIHARSSADEFTYALTEVADAISQTMAATGYMMAYAGNGAFVIVSSKAVLEPSTQMETDIQTVLDARDTEYDNGDPLDIEISIGNPLRPNMSRTQRIRKTFDRAIARAETRAAKKLTEGRSLGIRLIG